MKLLGCAAFMAPRAALLSAFLLLGCFPPGEGASPPLSKVYFPVGLAVDEDEKFLFIVNSDFDLQYNAGTVQSWDLAQVRARVPRYCESDADCVRDGDARTECSSEASWCVRPGFSPCGPFGEQDSRERSLYPGRCGFISQTVPQDGGEAILPIGPDGLVVPNRAVVIGAFATDVVRKKPTAPPGWTLVGDKERLFIPVRGDATLHWIDIGPNGTLECGQGGHDGSCDDYHRRGDSPAEENTRNGARLEPEPFGLDADENGMNLIVSNQTSGAVSLFSHQRSISENGQESTIQWSEGPHYQFREGGMPRRPMGVANMPVPLAMPSSGRERLPGFLVSFRDAAVVYLIRVYDDAAADPARPYTRRYESVRIETNSSGVDSRGIGVDASYRQANELKCLERFAITRECALDPNQPGCADAKAADFQGCLASASATPLEVFVANRTPSSLLRGRTAPITSDSVTSDIPDFTSPLPLDVGPSRVYVGDIINREGQRERRVFVLCFDSRRIAIYNPKTGELEAEVVAGRGPHAFALDVKLDADDGELGNEGSNQDHAFAYVGHFLDSYIGVIDLDQRHRGLYGTIIANVGKPVPPRASK